MVKKRKIQKLKKRYWWRHTALLSFSPSIIYAASYVILSLTSPSLLSINQPLFLMKWQMALLKTFRAITRGGSTRGYLQTYQLRVMGTFHLGSKLLFTYEAVAQTSGLKYLTHILLWSHSSHFWDRSWNVSTAQEEKSCKANKLTHYTCQLHCFAFC